MPTNNAAVQQLVLPTTEMRTTCRCVNKNKNNTYTYLARMVRILRGAQLSLGLRIIVHKNLDVCLHSAFKEMWT